MNESTSQSMSQSIRTNGNDVLLHQHTREELSAMAGSGYAVVVPLAATEQHGPHLPVYTDSLICERIALQSVRTAARSIPVLMAPLLAVGCSNHHLRFGGTISFSSSTYLHMLREIGESLIACGFRKIIFLNAHGGNDACMRQTAGDLAVAHPVWTAAGSYWNIAGDALRQTDAADVGPVPGHAGGFETALVLALQPDWVRRDRIVSAHPQREWLGARAAGTFVGKHGELTGADGYTDAAIHATAERGQRYLEAIAGSVAGWLVQVYRTMASEE